MMNKFLIYSLLAAICVIVPSCADHDDPKLDPIDTAQVKISATVKDMPASAWLNVTEELTISVSDIEMTAPKGVVLKSVSLVANNGTSRYMIDDKPFSGEPMEFKVPLNNMHGRINFSLRGNLIKKNSRDTEVMIADNIQCIVFSAEPQFECVGKLFVTAKSKSTSGEEYTNTFEVSSTDNFTIAVPQSELYWKPSSGTASTIELSLGCAATAWSPNTTFDCQITKTALGHNSGDGATLKTTIANTPGSLSAEKLQLYVVSSYFGTWENITITPYNLTNVFDITEAE